MMDYLTSYLPSFCSQQSEIKEKLPDFTGTMNQETGEVKMFGKEKAKPNMFIAGLNDLNAMKSLAYKPGILGFGDEITIGAAWNGLAVGGALLTTDWAANAQDTWDQVSSVADATASFCTGLVSDNEGASSMALSVAPWLLGAMAVGGAAYGLYKTLYDTQDEITTEKIPSAVDEESTTPDDNMDTMGTQIKIAEDSAELATVPITLSTNKDRKQSRLINMVSVGSPSVQA